MWEGENGRPVLVTNLSQIEFSTDSVVVCVVTKSSKAYFKLSN